MPSKAPNAKPAATRPWPLASSPAAPRTAIPIIQRGMRASARARPSVGAVSACTFLQALKDSQDFHEYRHKSKSGNDQGKHRSEEHTSELQSLAYLVCRLLLEKKKKKIRNITRDKRQQYNSEIARTVS